AALSLCLSSWQTARGRAYIGPPPISRAKEPDDLPLQPRAAGVAFPSRHQFRLLGGSMMNHEDITRFAAGLRGTVIRTGDAGYDEARKLYNAMIDKRPLLIARCADAADVIAAVNFGRDNGLPIAIRGGSHNCA